MRHSKPVRLETAPTGGESVYLSLEFTIKENAKSIKRANNLFIGSLVHRFINKQVNS